MKHKLKRRLCFCLLFVILCHVPQTVVQASTYTDITYQINGVNYTSDEFIDYLKDTIGMTKNADIQKALKNPNYINTFLSTQTPSSPSSDESDFLNQLKENGAIEVSSKAKMFSNLLAKTKKRTKKVIYLFDNVYTNYKNNPEKLIKEAMSYIEKKDEYTEGNITSYNASVAIYGSTQYVTFEFTYYTTAAQEKKVDAKVKKIVKSLNSGTTYQKIKKVHDYLCKNIIYDDALIKEGTYNALLKGSSVCNGYALAFQRIMDEMDIPCKYVTGTSFGVGHAWNIIKINGKWYNIDVTWDDSSEDDFYYDYFLKSPKDFKNHKRDADQTYSDCKMATTSYKLK